MKPRWLLLAVSVILLLVLGPASAFSALGVTIGCGDAYVDGVEEEAWDDALWLSMMDLHGAFRSASPAADDVPANGRIGLMNNEAGDLFVFEWLELVPENGAILPAGVPLDPENTELECEVAFNDEDALGTEWAADDCADLAFVDLAGEYELETTWDGLAVTRELEFEAATNNEECDEVPAAGVAAAGALYDSGDGWAACEWRVDPDVSEWDKIGLGDCFRFAAEIELETTVETQNYYENGGGDIRGGAAFPGPYDEGNLSAYFIICTNLCEPPVAVEEFVPEPATIMLMGSGLMGLAGYASLRLRKQ